MPLTISGSKKPQPGTSKLKPPIDKDAGGRVVLFMRLVAMNLEAREQLAYIVERRTKLEAQLADPALANHPKRPQAERRFERLQGEERDVVLRIAEINFSLAHQWDKLRPEDRNRYGLTKLIAADPEQDIGLVLWCDDRGLARLAPFPDGWAVPADISHRVLESPEVGEAIYTREELLNAPSAPF